MKNIKTEIRVFTIFEWKKEEDYLRNRHKQGWKFTYVNKLVCYHFEKSEPEDVIYQLDYNPDGLAHKSEYVQIFSDCGWEYLQDFFGYSYFRKPVSEMNGKEEEIFCDNASRLEMMKRVLRGRMTPLLCIFFMIILPNLFVQLHDTTLTGHILAGIYSVMLTVYLMMFLWCGIQYRKYRNSLQEQDI